MKELRTKKKWVSDYEDAVALTEEAEILLDFLNEGEGSPEQVESTFQKAEDAVEALEFQEYAG